MSSHFARLTKVNVSELLVETDIHNFFAKNEQLEVTTVRYTVVFCNRNFAT